MSTCANCDATEAGSFSDGRLIDGGYGSFDQTSLVWLDRDRAVEGHLCDACLEDLQADGAVEVFDRPGMFEEGQRPTLAAYQAIFEAGADRIRQSFHELNGARVYDSRRMGEKGQANIIELRAQLGEATPAFKSFEDKAMRYAEELLPHAPVELRKPLIRIVGLYVTDPLVMTEFMVTRYFDLLHGYAYGSETEANKAEGASLFWLTRATNPQLHAMEVGLCSTVSQFLASNTHQVIVARALLRMGALLMDMKKVDNLKKIFDMAENEGISGKEDFAAPDHNLFHPIAPPAAETQASAPASVPADPAAPVAQDRRH